VEIVIDMAVGVVARIVAIVVVAVVRDFSGSKNNRITRKQRMSIEMDDLVVENDNPYIGVYFVPTKKGAPCWVKKGKLKENKPGLISFDVPGNLLDGTYNLDVVTQYDGGGKILNDPKRITVAKNLRVSGSVPIDKKGKVKVGST